MDVQESARAAREAFGTDLRVLRFRAPEVEPGPGAEDPAVPDEVSIAVADGSPGPGYASYATLDMARYPTNVTADSGVPIRTELVTVARLDFRAQADVLSRCAFAIASGSFHVAPHCRIPNAVRDVDDSHAMKHALLVPPFLWPQLPLVVEEPDAVTTWLQAVPISDSELTFAADRGPEELFGRLESAGADVSDIDRTPVV